MIIKTTPPIISVFEDEELVVEVDTLEDVLVVTTGTVVLLVAREELVVRTAVELEAELELTLEVVGSDVLDDVELAEELEEDVVAVVDPVRVTLARDWNFSDPQ